MACSYSLSASRLRFAARVICRSTSVLQCAAGAQLAGVRLASAIALSSAPAANRGARGLGHTSLRSLFGG
jgi:hypothetical protein